MFTKKIFLVILVMLIISAPITIFVVKKVEQTKATKQLMDLKNQINNFIDAVDSYVTEIKKLKEAASKTPRYGLSEFVTRMVEVQSKFEALELPCPELKTFKDLTGFYISSVIDGFTNFMAAGTSNISPSEAKKYEIASALQIYLFDLGYETYITTRDGLKDFIASSNDKTVEAFRKNLGAKFNWSKD